MEIPKIILFKTNKNLNRAIRTSDFFGINKIYIYGCEPFIKGNLFKSNEKVILNVINNIPDDEKTIYFEVDGRIDIMEIDLSSYSNFIIGGESVTLPKPKKGKKISIKNYGHISGLTVEGALSIILFKWRLDYEKNNYINK